MESLNCIRNIIIKKINMVLNCIIKNGIIHKDSVSAWMKLFVT